VFLLATKRALAFFDLMLSRRAPHEALRINSCFRFHAPIVTKSPNNASTKKRKNVLTFGTRRAARPVPKKFVKKKITPAPKGEGWGGCSLRKL
jgi:hypothetical protein